MVTDLEKRFVYFSSLIKEGKYKPFWERLEEKLKTNNISYGFIEGTRDIWCRDYMPVQVKEDEYVQFRYFPDYLITPKHIEKLTIPSETRITKRINKRESDLVVDGGNVISYRDKFILTEKVFDENSNLERETVIKKLKSALNTDQIYFIPKEPYDIIGHADGFVRFVDENRIIVNNYSHQSISWKKKMDKALKDTGLEVITFPTEVTDEKNEEGVYSAKGIYINFAQIGRKILFPQFGFKTDSIALKEAKKEFPDCDIIPVDSNEIAMDGGVLNCITWNNKFSTKTSLTKGVKKAPTFEEQEEFVYDNIDFYLSSCDYERISNGFEKAWMGNEGEFMGDTDYKKVVYRHLENLIPKNLIPQYYVDKTVDLILEYMESIGQYGVDFGEN